ncbi:MAG: AMP-binding protein, partial [Thermoplasmata archaeon]|nr:AMP-binding protein [Thermoplasmata archaeon]
MGKASGELMKNHYSYLYTMSPKEIRRMQEKKLRNFIRYQLYPYSPYYRRLFDEKKIDPYSIRTYEDLQKIPLTKKEDILPTEEDPERYKKFILQPTEADIKKYTPKGKLLKLAVRGFVGEDIKSSIHEEYNPVLLIATSGTTGNNVPFFYTRYDIELFSASYRALAEMVGVRQGWKALNLFPFAPHLAFFFAMIAHLTGEWFMFHTGGGTVTSTKKALETMERIKPEVLIGIPSYIYHFVRVGTEMGVDFSNVKIILTAGEKFPLGSQYRVAEMLESRGATNVRIMDIYGTTEMRTAYPTCTSHSMEYHTFPDLHIVELVDPETGEQVGEGERGALAITNIDGRGTSVLRFLIGDIFEGGLTFETCPVCGSSAPRLIGPIGRIRDYDGNLNLTNVKGTLINLN